MTQKSLFNDDKKTPSSLCKISINKDFEKRYNSQKQRDELKNLSEARRNDDEDEETSEDEDSDAELITPDVGAKILTTIARIREKDPEIYCPEEKIFDDHDFENKQEKTTEKHKPLTFTKFFSSALKKDGADAFIKEDERLEKEKSAPTKLSYEDEQKALKSAFLAATCDSDNGDFLTKREVTNEEQEREEQSFKQFLLTRTKTKTGDEPTLLNRYLQSDENLDSSDKFLRDYIIYEGWRDANKMPQGDNKEEEEEEDAKILEVSEQFEAAYNFRFEEPKACEIEGHARRVLDSVRRVDDKRRQRRLEREARQKELKEEQKKDLKRLKALKRAEILERLSIIQRVAGIKTKLEDDSINLDGDFDPDKHEEEMKAIFGDAFDKEIEDDESVIKNVPEELCDIGCGNVPKPTDFLSKKQQKKLAKLAKRREKEMALMDEGIPYAPLNDDENNEELKENDCVEQEEAAESLSLPDCYTNELGEQAWFFCDGCRLGIRGGAKRYECTTCADYVLCTRCLRTLRHPHPFIRRRVPEKCQVRKVKWRPPDEYLKNPVEDANAPDDIIATTESATAGDAQSFSAEERSLIESALEEYYALEYEDIVGGMPVRFKYRKVGKNSHGLTTEDILKKDDKELNSIVHLKRLAPYRTETKRKNYKQKKRKNGSGGSNGPQQKKKKNAQSK